MMKKNNYMNLQRKLFVLTIISVLICLGACRQSPFTKAYLSIDQVVDDLNKDFISLEGIGYIRSAKILKYYSEEKIVDLHVRNSNIPEELLKQGINNNCFNIKQDKAIELFQLLLQGIDDKYKTLFDSIASFKYSARFNLQSPNDTSIAVVTLAPKRIKEALIKGPVTDKNEYALYVYCKGINILLPFVDDIATWESLEVDQNNLIYNTTVKDQEFDIENLDKQQIRADIINQFKDNYENSKHLLHYVFMTDRGIRYKYKSSKSGKTVVIQLSRDEVYDIIDKKI